MKRVLLLLLLLQSFSVPCQAAVYQWLDSQGVTHFTDDPDKIPTRYRSRAKELPISVEPAAPSAPSPAQIQPVPAPAPSPAAQDTGARGEQFWRSSFAGLRSQLRMLEEGLAAKQAKLVELHRKRVIFTRIRDREAVNEMQQEIAADELRVSQLREKLAELGRQADRALVPAEWRQ
jgi:vacuolar-type H+-ATPase subunit I/STV1